MRFSILGVVSLLVSTLLFLGCGQRSFVAMVDVKGGEFMQGPHDIELDWADKNMLPAHQVRVDDFSIGKYEITVGQYKTFVDETGYVTLAERADDPFGKDYKCWIVDTTGGAYKQIQVDTVSWRNGMYGQRLTEKEYNHPVAMLSFEDCLAFCRWLSEKEGVEYTLPTEAQWEFAARGGNKSKGYFASGSNEADKVAWYSENSDDVHNVGTKKPNELGIYDMSGNVREWTLDAPLFYNSVDLSETLVNPILISETSSRVSRGGSVNNPSNRCMNSFRTAFNVYNRGAGLGFRIVRNTVPNNEVRSIINE